MLTVAVELLFLIILCYYVKRVYFTLRGPILGWVLQFFLGNLLQTGVIGQNIPLNVAFMDMKSKYGDIFEY